VDEYPGLRFERPARLEEAVMSSTTRQSCIGSLNITMTLWMGYAQIPEIEN
jgi:hypothetical protein